MEGGTGTNVGTGRRGAVDPLRACSYVELPERSPCGFQEMDAAEAEELLADRAVGAFCVRCVGTTCYFSVKGSKGIEHDTVTLIGEGNEKNDHEIIEVQGVRGPIERVLFTLGSRYVFPILPMRPQYDRSVDYFFFLRVHVMDGTEPRIRCFPALLGRQQTVVEIVNLAATKAESHPDGCRRVSYHTPDPGELQRTLVTGDYLLDSPQCEAFEAGFLDVEFEVRAWQYAEKDKPAAKGKPAAPATRGPAGASRVGGGVTRRTTGPTVRTQPRVMGPTRTASVERLVPAFPPQPQVVRIPSVDRLYTQTVRSDVRPVSPAISARFRATQRSVSPVAVRVYSGNTSPRVPGPWAMSSPRVTGFVPPAGYPMGPNGRPMTPVLYQSGRRKAA